MEERSIGRGRAPYGVLVLDHGRASASPCVLRFTRRGLVLAAPGLGPVLQDHRHQETLCVPWRALVGLAADATVETPNGERVQLLEIVTDAGRLELAVAATGVAGTVAELARWARRWRWARRVRGADRLRPIGTIAALVALALGIGAVVNASPPPLTPRAAATSLGTIAGGGPAVSLSGMSAFVQHAQPRSFLSRGLVPASSPPPPAPPSVANEPPLSPHEVFGFVPYWALGAEGTFDVARYTTLAYFAIDVNANGTLDESGPGWDGFESQALADLVARAHAAGDRVVLTVNCFSPTTLQSLTTSPQASATLASSVIAAISAKNLDGVNIDFEGGSTGDRAGFSALVTTVARAVHRANAHYQVTVDTDGDAAGDPTGFYDVRSLAAAADGLFVMAYGLNLAAPPNASSPITSTELSDAVEAAQYATVVPPSKVIFATSYFGYSWATTNGTMSAHATATGIPVTYGQVIASGHPLYWDAVTDTAWTSYEVGNQWHEDYVQDPASVYLVAQLAQHEGFAGVGVWALGMDGGDAQLAAALDGNAPAIRAGPAGPAVTSASGNPGHPAPPAPAGIAARVAPLPSTTPSSSTTPLPAAALPSTPSLPDSTTTTTTTSTPTTSSTPATSITTTTSTTTTLPLQHP